jgi:hypothetical protein
MSWIKNLVSTYLGPALVAGVLIYGWWSTSDIDTKRAEIDELRKQTETLSLALSNQCRQILENAGFEIIEPKDEDEEPAEDEEPKDEKKRKE